MPELPEVEVVRRGLASHVVGRRIRAVEVRHPRAVRRHEPGARDFARQLADQRVHAAHRHGKFLWLELEGAALMAHLGMSGQLLIERPGAPDEKHLHIRLALAGPGTSGASSDSTTSTELRFVDQRTFGGMWIDEVPPRSLAHLGPDALDPALTGAALYRRLHPKHCSIKSALLDQSVIAGVGNIYADEALWRAKIHYATGCDAIGPARVGRLLAAVREVMGEALAVGGTSFDSLYVDVSGASGYFERELAAYGRVDQPCRRCGTAIVREPFGGRSSYLCPRCQPLKSPKS